MQRPAALLLVLFLAASLPLGATGAVAGLPTDDPRPPALSSSAVESTESTEPTEASSVPESNGAALLGGAGAAAVGGPAGASQVSDSASVSQTSFDRNRVVLTVYGNGSAEWRFHYRRTLENASERRNFEAFADEFNGNETSLYRRFKTDSRALTAEGRNVTGREMNATGFSRRAYVTNTTFGRSVGVVEMSFNWTGFAVERRGTFVVGDVFEGGLYLGPQQTLVISPGPDLVFQSVDPEGTRSNASSLRGSDSVTWQGEREFTDNRPRVVLAPPDRQSGAGSETRTATNTTGEAGNATEEATTTPPATEGDGLPVLPIGVGLLLVAAVAAAAWWYRDEEGDPSSLGDDDGPPGDGVGAASGAAAGGAVAADDEATAEGDAPPPELGDDELLSDEDRVVAMLRNQGGRMKQVKIVDQTGWSKSKVSMLLSEMEEDGEISKLRVGRENVISLKGHEPDAAGSPFGDGN